MTEGLILPPQATKETGTTNKFKSYMRIDPSESIALHDQLEGLRRLAEEGLPSHEVMDVDVDEAVPVVIGVRKRILDTALGRTRNAAGDDITDKVRMETEEAQMFGAPPKRELAARTWRDRLLESRVSKKRVKIEKHRAKVHALKAVYGRTDPQGRALYEQDSNGDYLPQLDSEGMPVLDWKGKPKLALRPNDLGTPAQLERLRTGRYTRTQKKSELKAARSLEKSEKKVDKIRGVNDRSRRNFKRINRAHKRPQIQRPVERVAYMAEPRHAVRRKIEDGRIAWHNAMAERAAKRADKLDRTTRDDDEFAQYDIEQSRKTAKGYKSRAQKARQRQHRLKHNKEHTDVTGWI